MAEGCAIVCVGDRYKVLGIRLWSLAKEGAPVSFLLCLKRGGEVID